MQNVELKVVKPGTSTLEGDRNSEAASNGEDGWQGLGDLRNVSEGWERVLRAREVKRFRQGLDYFTKHMWSRLRGVEDHLSTAFHMNTLCVYMCIHTHIDR